VIQAIYIEMVLCKESMSVPFSSFPWILASVNFLVFLLEEIGSDRAHCECMRRFASFVNCFQQNWWIIFDMYIPCEASSWTFLHQNRKLSSRISLQNQLFCLCRLPAVIYE
jgi:hypothetical protein